MHIMESNSAINHFISLENNKFDDIITLMQMFCLHFMVDHPRK